MLPFQRAGHKDTLAATAATVLLQYVHGQMLHATRRLAPVPEVEDAFEDGAVSRVRAADLLSERSGDEDRPAVDPDTARVAVADDAQLAAGITVLIDGLMRLG